MNDQNDMEITLSNASGSSYIPGFNPYGSGTSTGLGNGTTYIYPAGTSLVPPTTIYPQPNIFTTPSTSGYISINTQPEKYSLFELPRKKCPSAVYVNGRMVTLGIIGSDVECAYMGQYLAFSPGVLTALTYGNRITVILEYKTAMYHYNVGDSMTGLKHRDCSTILDAQLLSTIKK
jgi:hypothetical protein